MTPIVLCLSQIHVDPAFNVRKAEVMPRMAHNDPDPADSIPALADSIRRDGLLVPVIVREIPGPEVRVGPTHALIAGFRRYAALSLIAQQDTRGDMEVRCEVFEGSDADALVVNAVENVRRGALRLWEVSDRCWELNALGMKPKEIAQRLGRSEGNVRALIALSRGLAPEVQRAWRADSGACSFGRLVEWVAMPFADQVERLAKALEKVDVTDAMNKRKEARHCQTGASGKRRKRVHLAAAVVACEGKAGAYAEGVRAALRFALGDEGNIPDEVGGMLYDPKAAGKVPMKQRLASVTTRRRKES